MPIDWTSSPEELNEISGGVGRQPLVKPESIPDKLYAQARAEGYEAGMRDAARLAYRCGKLEFQELLLDVKFRTKLLKDIGDE